MTRPLRIQYPDAYYHVTCRGNERREIFRNNEDREVFCRLLGRSLDIFGVKLLTYALMPNHFHLLICTPKGNLSEFMRHFNISYTGVFNRKYNRSGHLYQGRYIAFLIDADNYLLEVSRYIHLNPLRMKSKEPPEKIWQDLLQNAQTSLPGYLHDKNKKEFVHYTTILDYFGCGNLKSRNEYRKFVQQGIYHGISSPLTNGKGTGIIGRDDFVEEIKQKQIFSKDRQSARERPALRALEKIITPEELIEHYSKLMGMRREDLSKKGKQSPERAMLMEFLYRFCGITQPEIGRLLGGIDYSAVSQARKRLQLKTKNDSEWGKKFNEVQYKLEQMSILKI